MTDYTLQPIPGKTLSRRLPEGTALVLEGGGLRGYYSCGVMEAFMEKDLLFPYIIGVSAGAAKTRFRTYRANRGAAERSLNTMSGTPTM